ncbi:hypothetical protein HHI36_005599, partial [Cryptolaemus montrouzieri]
MRKQSKKEGVGLPVEEKVSSIPSIVDSEKPEITIDKMTKSTESRRKVRGKSKSRSILNLQGQLRAGVFCISPSTGTVQAGETTSITIQSELPECEKYEETIVFFVSEANCADRKGRVLTLHIEGTEPSISFNDHNFMFPEVYVVKDRRDLPYIGENLVFEINKQRLYFGKVAVNQSVETRFRIPNTGHVTATVYFDLKENDDCFNVKEKIIDICPYKFAFNTIKFTPKTIGVWTSRLDVKCQTFSSKHILSYNMYLKGEACMPTFEIIEPQFCKIGEMPQISFDPVFEKCSSEKNFVLKNNGQVPCKLMVEVCEDPQRLLSLSSQSEVIFNPYLLEQNENQRLKRSIIICLKPEEEATVILKFQPTSPIEVKAELNIFVADNCFDKIKLPIIANCYSVVLYLKDLPITLDDQRNIRYSLNFGSIEKHLLNKLRFTIINPSKSICKFEFGHFPGLKFCPKVGHLYPDTQKFIIAGFITHNHITLKQ